MIVFRQDGIISGSQEIGSVFGFRDEECADRHLSMFFAPAFKGICLSLALESQQKREQLFAEGQSCNGAVFVISIMVTEVVVSDNEKSYIANISKVKMNDALITVSKSGEIKAANQGADYMFKKSFHEMCGTPISFLIPDLEGIENCLLKMKGEKRQVLGKDSTGKNLSLLISLQQGPAGLITVSISNLDLSVDLGLFMTIDENGNVVETSSYQYFSQLGYLSNELVGKNISDIIPELDVDTFLEKSRTKRQKRGSGESSISTSRTAFRVNVFHKNGSQKPFVMNIWKYKNNLGKIMLSAQLKQGEDATVPALVQSIPSRIASYRIGKELDDATGGTVYSAVDENTGESVVLKIQDKRLLGYDMQERINQEFQVAQKLNHPNVINYLEQIQTGTHVLTVMEYGKDGNLERYWEKKGKLSETEARYFFSQIIEGVKHCHENNCVHGDIKLSNIVLRDGIAKLIDFSVCKPTDDSGKRRTFCGTTQYVAPEVLLQNLYPGKSADIWSLGVCLFVMLTGNYPFSDIPATISGNVTFPQDLSGEVVDLIKRILTVNTTTRYTLEQITAHPWMKKEEPIITGIEERTERPQEVARS
jgi:PAS domain S-box-containing protein